MNNPTSISRIEPPSPERPAATAAGAFRLTSRLLQDHPVLLVPPLLMILYTSAIIGSPAILPLLTIVLLNLAVTNGWYRLIALAALERALTWDDFLEGIGKHFVQAIAGTLAFFGGLFLLFVPIAALAQNWAGDPNQLPLKAIQTAFEKWDPSALPLPVLLTLARWSLVLTGLFLLYSIAAYLLLLWPPALVLKETDWLSAWRYSLRATILRWKPLGAILTVNGLAWGFVIALRLLGGHGVWFFLASFATLVAEIYFRTAYAAFLFLSEPSENILPSLSEDQSIALRQ